MLHVQAHSFHGAGPMDMLTTFRSFYTSPPSLPAYLRDTPHDMQKTQTQSRKGVKDTKWFKQFAVLKRKLGVDVVNALLVRLNSLNIARHLNGREKATLAIAAQQLAVRGVDVFQTTAIVQIDMSLTFTTYRADISLCPCVVPKGKYVLTGIDEWRVLSAADHLLLQGVGLQDQSKYMIVDQLGVTTAKDGAGNAFSSSLCSAALFTLLAHWRR